MQIVATDIVGPFPASIVGTSVSLLLLTILQDGLKLFQEAVTITKTLMDHMFCHFWMADQLHSDMGSQFESEMIKELSKILQIRKIHMTPYHPYSDGLVISCWSQ